MPVDIYNAIIGDPLTDEEKLRTVAEKLRRQSLTGQLGQLTGDKVLSPLGGNLYESTENQAALLGKLGEQARYRRYQEDATRDRLGLGYAQLQADREDMGLRRAIAMAKAKDKDYRKMTINQAMKLQDEATQAQDFTNVANTFDDKYAGTGIPGGRELGNFMSANVPALTSEETEAAAAWWAKYNNIHTLPERNELFGATLTPAEKVEWKKNAISPNMSPKQIRASLEWYQNKSREALGRRKKMVASMDFDPEEVEEIYGVDLSLNQPASEEVEYIDLPPRRARDRPLPGED